MKVKYAGALLNNYFNENILTIQAKRSKEGKEEGANYVRTERSYGSKGSPLVFYKADPVKPGYGYA
ncbi:MAG: hypothetical protein PHY77_04495 [Desulfotomaculaceae bacterium]|nr:hypothetical protein [Desulfotomaculaceae bacterium]